MHSLGLLCLACTPQASGADGEKKKKKKKKKESPGPDAYDSI